MFSFTGQAKDFKKPHNKGLTLVELIVVIAIMAILASIAVPSFIGYLKTSKGQVCNTNCSQLKRMYQANLFMKDVVHSELVFTQYSEEYGEVICPDNGDISYENEEVKCSVHGDGSEGNDDEDPGDEVPWI